MGVGAVSPGFDVSLSSASAQPSILIVEDEALVRIVSAEIFRDFGFTVIEAASGDEALLQLQGRSDLTALFTDVQLPGTVDGLLLANRARALSPNLKIVVTSGRVRGVEDRLPERASFVAKPYDAAEIAAMLFPGPVVPLPAVEQAVSAPRS